MFYDRKRHHLYILNMSEEKKNPIADILARKKAQQQNHKGGFNPKTGQQGKVNSKGFGGPSVTRKTGRGS